MSRIFARSPYIIEVNVASSVASKIEIFIWNNPGSAPTTPNYTLQKEIPSPTDLKMYYDVSPYIREYISWNTRQQIYNTIAATDNSQWCNVTIKRYQQPSGGAMTLIDTTTYKGFDGYGYYSEGGNPDLGKFLLSAGTYFYHYDINQSPSSNTFMRAGSLVFERDATYNYKYTALNTGATNTGVISSGDVVEMPRVYTGFYSQGNKLEIINSSAAVVATYTFKPKEECRYTPIVVDFVNKYGAWQREFFFKVSDTRISTSKSQYNLMQSSNISWSTLEGQRKEFNANGIESLTARSGYVEESFFESLQQMMLSERGVIGDLPVKVKSNSLTKQQNQVKKLIDYTIEFEYTFDMINSVI